MGFPPEYFTVLFAIPRMAGYLAHWRESLDDPDTKIMRPQQVTLLPFFKSFLWLINIIIIVGYIEPILLYILYTFFLLFYCCIIYFLTLVLGNICTLHQNNKVNF